MKKNRVLAVIMAVLMMVTLLPSMVFAAAAPQGALDGKLKIKGTIAVGVTLSADYSKVKPEGITDDYVSFSWSLKDGDLLTEVGTDKTYKVEEKDLGLPIVLKITGKEEMGISGELTVTTQEVSATEEEAKALAQQKKEEAADSESELDETSEQDSTEESTETAAAVLTFSPEDGMTWPVSGDVILNYSMDAAVYFQTLEQYKYNPAIYISAVEGTPVSACAKGVVKEIGTDAQLGQYVVTTLGSGYEVIYGQLTDLQVEEGATVARGQVIGNVAKTTKYFSVEGDHVYLEILKDGTPVDPLQLLQ